jgi:hypothetical protein
MTNLRPKLKSDVNPSSREAHAKFVRDTGRKDIDYKKFRSIIITLNGMVLDKVMSGRFKIRFPKLGLLTLIKVLPSKLIKRIDWGRYRKDGVYTTYKNYHTNGLMYRIFFYTYERKYPYFGFYNFKLNKPNRQKLSKMILNNEVR